MEGTFESASRLQTGESIAVVTYTDETARLTQGEVTAIQPLVVRLPGNDPSLFPSQCKVMLLGKSQTPSLRGRTTIATSFAQNGNTFVTFADFEWELEDRRKYARVNAQVPVQLKLVQEDDEALSFTQATGQTVDLSLGGAAVRMDTPVPVGTLLKFEWTSPEGDVFKSLAIVLHEKEEAGVFGIEFVNFIGEGRNALEQLISRAA